MSEKKKPVDPTSLICPIYKAAAIIAGHISIEHTTPPDNVSIHCDGEDCAGWSRGSGVKRCGLRNV